LAKNFKLNIKNTQLAQALKLQSGKKKKSVDDSASVNLATKKPKARIVRTSPKSIASKHNIIDEQIQPGSSSDALSAEEKPAIASIEPKESQTLQQEVETQNLSTPEEKTESSKEDKKVVSTTKQKKESKEEKPSSEKSVSSAQSIKEKSTEKPPAKGKAEQGFKNFRDFKATRRKDKEVKRVFDSRDRQGLRDQDSEIWRKKKKFKRQVKEEPIVIRPKNLKIRLPITIKDLAQEMKYKASELISKLFMQGITLTLNDYLEDETTVQLLGQELHCDIVIDTAEEERLRITSQTILDEIQNTDPQYLESRCPVIAFMGHVDHGKTSLIDAIRKTQITSTEAGNITQHIGAFKTGTAAGELTILDTPGHEAFAEMRERGANVTDIVVLVVAGDEGIKAQTLEAMQQVQASALPIVVAINKSDKANFDEQKIYRQLADNNFLPEAWGGTCITVNCSAVSLEGIQDLLDMVLLQAEILELKANPHTRARGTILESQMHKGLGAVATILVQNGTLKMGDAIVLGNYFGRIKTMHDECNRSLAFAGPSTPVKITGISNVAKAGSEFIVVDNEKEARMLAQARALDSRQSAICKKTSLEKLLQKQKAHEQKVFPVILQADVQGSLEALKTALLKIPSSKIRIEIVAEGIGEISESDVELAIASKAVILGFHTRVENHAESMSKQHKVIIRLHDIIYHAIDDIKQLMAEKLDPIPEEIEKGKAVVKAVFKSSQHGVIAGCLVTEGTISRNHMIRVVRDQEQVWQGKISSMKRVQEDVKEAQKGVECGILLDGFSRIQQEDILESFEVIYHKPSIA
jgi:translation initiation factor IF-2